ncbi:hypothetical protein [Paludisphaera borealis]|uniref:Uncharacterized protein n=1 Tax=Paludisphaera borealis TaxID=1387353 RepID=A0A1U7CJX7_9BACT|nr:hypothetical protein [Paludisphaera borealis]APW59208.1 hypothetical protein BSF38_00623 [Paludisphaera borealis]
MIGPSPASPRCRHCPVASGSSCAGVSVVRLCELVDPAHPDYNPAYLDVLRPVPERPPGIADDHAPGRRRRGLAETLALLSAMKACPHRIERTDCGCGGLASCTSGKGRAGVVHSGDCFDCLDANVPRNLPHRTPGEGNPP